MPAPISSAESRSPVMGIVLILTAASVVMLFLMHPAENAVDFSGFVKEEAANQVRNGVIHGGFVLLLGIQLACYAIFTCRWGWHRPFAIAGLWLFAVGAVLQMGAILADGVITPALALRYATEPADRLAAVRGVFALCGIANRQLGLFGGIFEAGGILSWGVALMRLAPWSGSATVAIGLAMMGALAASVLIDGFYALLAIFGLIAWASVLGALTVRRPV